MLDLPSLSDIVSRFTQYVEGSVEHLYWGSMMRHVPGLKQLCMSKSVDLRLDLDPLEEDAELRILQSGPAGVREPGRRAWPRDVERRGRT